MPVSPYSYVLNNPVLLVDNDGRDVFIYYVGPQRKWYNSSYYYLNGHTAIGARPDGFKKTFYHPTSGNIGVVDVYEDGTDELGYSSSYNEEQTILEYARTGDIVIRMRIKLDPEIEQILVGLVANGINGRDVGGLYCTRQVFWMLVEAYIEAGYSEKEAYKAAKKILWYKMPEYPTEEELREAGFYGFDLYFKDEKTGEIKEINARFENDENERKTEGFNNLMNNFSSLESGTYIWNGSSWVKQ